MVAIAPANIPLVDLRVNKGQRLNRAAALRLANTPDLLALGNLATIIRERRHGESVFVTPTRHLTLARQDAMSLAFCGEDRDEGEDPALLMTVAEYAHSRPEPDNITALHVVVGDPDRVGWELALESVQTLRRLAPRAVLRAFSAADVWRWRQTARLALPQMLSQLRHAGVDALTGGGARGCLVPSTDWPDTAQWLAVHRTAHRLGMPSSATFLYGLGETMEHRVALLLAMRALQDETGGFTHCIVARYAPPLGSPVSTPSAIEDLRMTALCRLVLDNVAHISHNWENVGIELAQASLQFGVDTLDGTLATATTRGDITLAALEALAGALQRQLVLSHWSD